MVGPGVEGGGRCAGPAVVAGGGRGHGATGRSPVVVPALNSSFREPTGADSVNVRAGVEQFGLKVRSNLEKALAEDERGSSSGSGREFSEGGGGGVASWECGSGG